MVYDPPLNATFGVEYCRNNMNVSFGTWHMDKKNQGLWPLNVKRGLVQP
jgi:hypothetical protein